MRVLKIFQNPSFLLLKLSQIQSTFLSTAIVAAAYLVADVVYFNSKATCNVEKVEAWAKGSLETKTKQALRVGNIYFAGCGLFRHEKKSAQIFHVVGVPPIKSMRFLSEVRSPCHER